MGCQQFNKEHDVYKVGSDDDTGWLVENSLNLLVKNCNEKYLLFSSECTSCGSQDKGQVKEPDNNYQSDEDNSDYQDLDDEFYLTSYEEEKMLFRFINCLVSVDGSTKLPIQGWKVKRVLMSIVRHKGANVIDHKLTACPSCLNLWMQNLRNEEKEPGTIGTYLNSLKHFTGILLRGR